MMNRIDRDISILRAAAIAAVVVVGKRLNVGADVVAAGANENALAAVVFGTEKPKDAPGVAVAAP